MSEVGRPLGRSRRRGLAAAALVVLGLGLAGCSVAPPSVTPPSEPPPTTSASPVPPTPTATAAPTSAPSASPTSAGPCAIEPETGRLPSDRLVDVQVSSTDTADVITFVFGPASSPSPPQGASNGSLEIAEPPYTQGASGLPIEVDGEHVIIVRFDGMTIMDEGGVPTYDSTLDFRPGLPALKTLVNYDMFEGVVGWYIGFDGDGCVDLSSDATSVSVVVEHPRS